MSVVNARLNKNVVRRAADRLLKIAGFGRTVVNYKLNKRANRMRSTILLFAFSKAQRGALKLRCPTHRDLDTSQGVVIGTALHMNNKEGMLRFMNYGTIEATFAYQDVQWARGGRRDRTLYADSPPPLPLPAGFWSGSAGPWAPKAP